MKIRRIGFLLISALGFLLLAAGCKTIEGRVAVKGSEPHTYLVIETDKQSYEIVGEHKDLLYSEHQNKQIKVKGKVLKEADGHLMPGEFEVIKIIKIYP